MPIQVGFNFSSEMVTKRTHKQIVRDVNRQIGQYIADTILPRKFSRQAFAEYPQTFERRTKSYRKSKQRKVGHQKPNVLTGRMKRHVLTPGLGHRVTATANRGRVYITNYFPMPERQRQEMEVVSQRDRRRMAQRAEQLYLLAVNDPKNQRKRAIKRSKK